jgi:FkbM family methyltransferase
MLYLPLFFVKILYKSGLLRFFRIGYTLKISGKKFKIPVIENNEGFMYHQNITEPYFLNIIQQFYKQKNFVFIDVGVNFGQTLLKVKAVSGSAKYIGFEPSGLCAYYTLQLIKANKIPCAELLRCALSDKNSLLEFYAYSEGDTRGSLMQDQLNLSEAKYRDIVPAFTLDSCMEVLALLHEEDILLKIDVEGAEFFVLEGARKFIECYHPIVIFEVLPGVNAGDNGDLHIKISEYFTDRSYSLFVIDEKAEKVEQIDRIDKPQDLARSNFLAVPKGNSRFFSFN